MRSKILQLLKDCREDYISGEEIATRLQVSRTAIWKHIKALRDSGYIIESSPRNGYKLLNAPDLLSIAELIPQLNTKFLGHELHYFDVIDSTNTKAKELATKNCADGTVVIADYQTQGRGRLARSFFSPKSMGIYASVVLRPAFLPPDAPKCTLMAAVAIAQAIEEVTKIRVGIKWPNDLLYQGHKIAGILTEMNAEMDKINYIIVGFGININQKLEDIPEELQSIMSSLAMISGEELSRQKILISILQHLEQLYIISQEQGFSSILDIWRKYAITLNQEIKVLAPNETYVGIAMDIDDDGALLVQVNGQIKRVLAGDVSIRNHR